VIASSFVLLLGIAAPVHDHPTGEDRATRLAEDQASLRGRIERMRALPFRSIWLAAVEDARSRANDHWLETRDGLLRDNVLDLELLWNRPLDDRERPWALDYEHERHPLGCIVDLAEQFEQRGIELVVVPIPTRLNVRPDLVLPSDVTVPEPFDGIALGRPEFLLALSERGVDVVDALPHLARMRGTAEERGPEAFLRYDTHWTPEGARIVAELVHERLRSLPGYEPGPLVRGRDFELRRETIAWAPKKKLAGVAVPQEVPIVRVVDPEGAPLEWKDRKSPILVLGDSLTTFHRDDQAAFFQHLGALAGRPLDVVAVNGLGATGPRRTIRRRRVDDLGEKRVVVWAFGAVNLSDPHQWRPAPVFPEGR